MNTNLKLSHNFATHALQVEELTKQDIPLALDLIASIKTSGCLDKPHHLKDREENELIQLIDDGYPLLGIKNFDGKLISFATISKVSAYDNELMIRSLCTSPDFTGHGCGGKIVQAAVNWMNENGDGKNIRAKVASDNKASLTLFSKAGFIPVDLQWDGTAHYEYYIMERGNQAPEPVRSLCPLESLALLKIPEHS